MRKENPLFVIGISGLAGAGKSTLASALMEESWVFTRSSPGMGHATFFRESFADPIRSFVRHTFQFDPERMTDLKNEIDPFWGFSPRKAMQMLGTEWGRALHPDTWTRYLAHRVRQRVQDSPDRKYVVVVDDVRFPNEISALSSLSPNLLLVRLSQEGLGRVNQHASEDLPSLPDDQIRSMLQPSQHIWSHENKPGDQSQLHERAMYLLCTYVRPWLS